MQTLGVDLGTTFTCAFTSDQHGNLEILELHHGSRITRSVVQIANRKWSIPRPRDQPSQQRIHLSLAKRILGRTTDDGRLRADIQAVSNARLEANNPVFRFGDECAHPDEVSAFILGRIRKLANARSNTDLTACVLAVPAYFTHQQREATLDAAEMAGFDRHGVRLVPEPLAALVAHVDDNKSIQDGHWFVIDIGGGTADITVAYIEKSETRHSYVVNATAGDNSLGGSDFDEGLIQFTLKKAEREYGGLERAEDWRHAVERRVDLVRLRAACEVAKEELSTSTATTVALEDQMGDELQVVEVTVEEAEGAWAETISEIRYLFTDALEHVKTKTIENVLVAGGTGNMRCIKSIINEMLPDAQVHHSHLSEAVGRGAAIIGANPKITTTDVLPRAIGIELDDGSMGEILGRNEALPAQARESFGSPEDNSASIRITVFEGNESQAKDNIRLGNFVIEDLPPLPKETPVEVEISIDRLGEVKATACLENQSESLNIKYEPRRTPEELRTLSLLTSMRLDGKTTADGRENGNSRGSLKRSRSDGPLTNPILIPIKRHCRDESDSCS